MTVQNQSKTLVPVEMPVMRNKTTGVSAIQEAIRS